MQFKTILFLTIFYITQLLPYCNIKQSSTGEIEVKYAMETELLKVLERKFNFQTNYIYGKQSWPGMLGQVVNYVSFKLKCVQKT